MFLWRIGFRSIALKIYQELLGFGVAHPQQLSGAEVFQQMQLTGKARDIGGHEHYIIGIQGRPDSHVGDSNHV